MTTQGNGGLHVDPSRSLRWEPESPFLPDPVLAQEEVTSTRTTFAPFFEVESPFVSAYEVSATEITAAPQAQMFATLSAELHDHELGEAIQDLVNELSAILDEQFAYEVTDPGSQRVEMERRLRDHMAPLERECESLIERVTDGIGQTELARMSESEIDTLLNEFAPTATDNPVFDGFVRGWFNKAKKAVKAAARTVGKVLPMNFILGKLKALVRPLLRKVLRTAIDKLPAAVQPVARQLAARLSGTPPPAPATDILPMASAAAVDPASIQRDVDAHLAGYMIGGDRFDQEAVAVEVSVGEVPDGAGALLQLEHARAQFSTRVVEVDPEEAGPVVEQFVPAILAVAKAGINIIGRHRVVRFLSNLLAKLISPYVGKEPSRDLSRYLVDTGLRLLKLEMGVQDRAADRGTVLTATVEDTIHRLLETAPAAAWESVDILQGYVEEAFEKAASAQFPDNDIRTELHEATTTNGAWVPISFNKGKVRYKKYTRVIEVSLTPQIAGALRSFGGVSMTTILRDKLRITLDAPTRMRVHMYEAVPGTTLSGISAMEKNVPGLGSRSRTSWSLFHPLTPTAAGLLLREPGLGRSAEPRFLRDRTVISLGQRFYYLEIPGVSGIRPTHETQTRVILDMPRREVRVYLFYSERDAQDIKALLQRKPPLPLSTLQKALRVGRDLQLRTIFSQESSPHLQIIPESGAPDEEGLLPILAPGAREIVKKLVTNWIVGSIESELKVSYERLVAVWAKAADAGEDGLTMILKLRPTLVFDLLRQLVKTGTGVAWGLILSRIREASGPPGYDIQIRPGFAYP